MSACYILELNENPYKSQITTFSKTTYGTRQKKHEQITEFFFVCGLQIAIFRVSFMYYNILCKFINITYRSSRLNALLDFLSLYGQGACWSSCPYSRCTCWQIIIINMEKNYSSSEYNSIIHNIIVKTDICHEPCLSLQSRDLLFMQK